MSNSSFLPIGTLLSCQYKILQQIGAGGFGQTYLVEDQLGMKKVVKELFISSMCTRDTDTRSVVVSVSENKDIFQQQLDKFREEARRIFSLSHPNIVKVSALFNENNTAYYVMDYIEGESLAQKSRRTPLTEPQIMRYLNQLLSAFEYIHSHGVTHLDLKPGNIMIDRNDNVVLIDFGASKLFNIQSVNKTMMTSMRPPFTPGYAPIEQENGNVKDMGPHCDIYALGATLYTIYVGTRPASPFEIFQNGLPEIPNASPKMQDVIKKAMAFMVKDRIKDIAEFRQKLGLPNDDNTMVIGTPPIETFTVKGVSFKMIKVEGGTFKMGAQDGDPNGVNYDSEALYNEKPVHSVTLNDYYIGETEVTQELWEAVMGSNPSAFEGAKNPVECVSWNDCQEFINKLNQLTGKRFCLPTEAQWEYAARGGNKSLGYIYSGSNTIGEVAWYNGNVCNGVGSTSPNYSTHRVGTKSPNELGIYDMSGNVFEWCSDWYDEDYYLSSPITDPTGPITGLRRVYRGGCWSIVAHGCRVSYRDFSYPDLGDYTLGFRLVLPFK